MAGIDFITSNPATDAFQKAEKLAQDTDANDLKMQKGLREESEAKQSFPTKLRKLNADTSLSETNAQTASDEAPYAGPLAKTKLRQANATATNTENQSFYKSIELLDKGDIEGAKAVAATSGHTIPDSVINDADTRAAVSAAAKRAQELYPNRPKDQQSYITGALDDAFERTIIGQPANDRTAPYTVSNAPEPQETSDFKSRWEMLPATRTNPDNGQPEQGYIHHDKTGGDSEFVSGTTLQGRGGANGAGGRKITGTEAIINELRRENPNLSYQDALAIAKRSGQSPDALTLRKEAIALSAAKADTNFLTNPDQTIETYRRKYGLGQPPSAAPGPTETITNIQTTPAPIQQVPARPGQMAPGDGGKPLNIETPPLPPNLPAGVQYQYSPARRQFRDELGRTYDLQGNQVS